VHQGKGPLANLSKIRVDICIREKRRVEKIKFHKGKRGGGRRTLKETSLKRENKCA